MMAKRPVLYTIFVMIVVASMLLAGCGGAKPTPTPTVVAQPGNTQPVNTAPQPTQATKKVATFIWTQEFDSLNPMYSNMWFSQVTQQLWDCWAWNFDQNNEPLPNLVTEMPSIQNQGISADGKTITLHLRDGIKWSDNVPLTSEDFRFTWAMHKDSHNTVASAYPYDKMTSVETPDPKTVVINFESPFAPWIVMWKGILPAHILQPVFDAEGTLDNAQWNKAPTVGCGPYNFAKWESGSYAQFVRNDNYWGTPTIIDEIFMRFVPDDASQVAALTNGDGDIGTFIAYPDIPKLSAAGINIVTQPSGYDEGLFFLVDTAGNKGNPGLRDVNVRKAIAMGINRDGIDRDLLLGKTKVPASYWDSLPFYNNPPLGNYAYDPEAAKKLLDQAGWVDSNGDGVREKGGVQLVLKYGTTVREIRQDVQAVIQQQLADIGIKVEIQSYADDLYFSQDGPAAKGEIDIMEWSDAPYGFPDPDIYYWLCSEIPTPDYPAGANWFYTCDKKLDELIQLQSSQVDPAERQKTISQINQIFYDQVYWLGLWQDPDVWAIGPRLLNVKLSGVTPFYSISEWDLTAK
jgi:peptide/nickel transport system substrate-binding protein